MTWRIAKSLLTLRDQVNAAHPDRRKENDGTIGDAAHASRTSDHNPWVRDDDMGIVTAMDITHDPAHGVDTYAMAEIMRQNRDPRIKYVISNHRIFSSQSSPWQWRTYNGANPHDHHVHVSVLPDKAHYDDVHPWNLKWRPATPVEPEPTLRRGSVGAVVERLQATLHVTVDGNFGPITEAAVKKFQTAHGLVSDGIVGFYTWRELQGE